MDRTKGSPLRGHVAAYQSIMNAIKMRPAHSWILHGPSGIGKTTFAVQIAKYLLSFSARDQTQGFWECVAQKSSANHLVEINNHPDFLLLTPEEQNSSSSQYLIEDIRRIQNFARKTSTQGLYRVIVIEEAENMTRQAANALLKVLEEPPQNVFIFLITHRLGSLLPTVRSRGQKLAFFPLPHKEFLEHFSEHSEREILFQLSEGRIGFAHKLIEEGGLALYEAVLTLCGAAMQEDNLGNVFQEFLRSHGAKNMTVQLPLIQELIFLFLKRTLAFRGFLETPRTFLEKEKEIMSAFYQKWKVGDLWQIWTIVSEKFQVQRDFHLDPTHLLINTFFYLGNCQKAY